MFDLGIYSNLYGDAPITAGRALLIAAVGFTAVFLVLGLLALFVKGMGLGFDAAARRKKKPLPAPAPAPAAPDAPADVPLPANESAGMLTLIDVSEEEAALIMAVVSHKSGVPLNRLQFNSIKRLPEDEK